MRAVATQLCAWLAAVAVLSPARAQDPKIEFDSGVLDFGTILSGTVKTLSVDLRNTGDGDLHIVKIRVHCGCVTPSLVMGNRTVKQLDLERSGQPLVIATGAVVRLDVELNTAGRHGELDQKVHVFTNDPAREQVSLAVKAICDPGYVLTPKMFHFGEPVIRGTTATRSVVIEPSENWQGSITGASYRLPGVVVKWHAVAAGDGTRIDVTITDQAQVGHLLWPVEVATDSATVPKILIPLYAEVSPVVRISGPDARQPRLLDFGSMLQGKPVTRDAQIVNHDATVPYHVGNVVIKSKQKKHVKAEIVTLEQGMKYVLRLTVNPTLQARAVRGVVRLESGHPTVPALEISFRGWVKRR